MSSNDPHTRLGDPARVRALTRAVRTKIPARDVEDVVQSTLADALAAAEPPLDEGSFDRWLFGIARHKVADYYRRHRRHEVLDHDALERDFDLSAGAAGPSPESARDLLRWVNDELPKGTEAPRTLEWMLREASGDRLETIAEEHALPAPAVRQRVSRLRRYLRERWALQLAAALGLFVVITGIYAYRQYRVDSAIQPDLARREITPLERARQIREAALNACRAGNWQSCLDELERAKLLDPPGDDANEVRQARQGAAQALHAPPTPVPTPSAQPSPSPSLPPTKSEPTKSEPTKSEPTKSEPTKLPVKTPPTKLAPSDATQSNALPRKPSFEKKQLLQKQPKAKNSEDFAQQGF